MTCADACARCQLALALFLAAVHSVSSPDGLPTYAALLEHPRTLWRCAKAFVLAWLAECAVAAAKHLQHARACAVPVRERRRFLALLCADARAFAAGSDAPFLTQRLGYLPLPQAAVLVRVVVERVVQTSQRPWTAAAVSYAVALALYSLLHHIVLFVASLFRQAYVCAPTFLFFLLCSARSCFGTHAR